tara:strand:- start:3416 stop:3958 length:543 start_codon:yes stop_codon:yes gene_type:complete
MNPQDIAKAICPEQTVSLYDLPDEQGLYALADHDNLIRYVGITTMTIRRRVEQYHVAGDGNSHKFSTVYNAGRLWHERKSPYTDQHDGAIAKKARREIVRRSCRAIGFSLPGLSKGELEKVEQEVIARVDGLDWNGKRKLPTIDLGYRIHAMLRDWSQQDLLALERQNERWLAQQESRTP